jgi:radical SAM-linked protein
MSRVPTGPTPAPVVARMRVRYGKRGRLRFTSARDFSRAFERALRRAGVPVAISAGFTPHPRVSYSPAAPTGVASEAEYLELALTEFRDPEELRATLDGALPRGLDVLDVAAATGGSLADRLVGSDWEIRLPGVATATAAAAVAAFLAADRVEVTRMTKGGLRTIDARAAVVRMVVDPGDGSAPEDPWRPCAILRVVVRHVTPAVRPDDVLSGLRSVADLAPPVPPMVTRLAQGPLDEATGAVDNPIARERGAAGGWDPPGVPP